MNIETRILQLELLKMMKEFHKTCEENGYTYYMIGGTLLGAIRHKGFIPWDDDMDVGMPREDFERFCQNAVNTLPDGLELRFYRNTDKSPFHYAKLINKNTTLIEPKYHDYIEGIYIDVFPLDNMTKYDFRNRLRTERIWLKHAFIMNHCSTEKKKGLVRKIFQGISKIRNLNKMHISIDKLMREEEKEQPVFLCNFLGAWKEKEILPVAVYGNPVPYPFEDTQLYGPSKPDQYLSSVYGDYMKYPPLEKRVCRHNYFFVSLDIPYKDYIKNNKPEGIKRN